MQSFVFSLGYVWKSEIRSVQLFHTEQHEVIFALMAGQYMTNY